MTGTRDALARADSSPAPPPCLTIKDLTRPGLGPVSLSMERGDCLAIRGPSGSGKTLLLRAIADLDPNTGTIRLGDRDRGSMPAPHWRRKVSYLPTEPGWWANSVGEHFPDWHAARALVAALGLPADCDRWTVQRLSTGERQRLGLVRAMIQEPDVLLLDEPTSGLDTDATDAVETMIAGIRRDRGTAILWVTHDDAQAGRIATRRVTIENGQCR